MEGMVIVRIFIAASFFLILSVSAGSSAYSCPSVCTCYVDEFHGLRTANCSGVKFLAEHKYNKLFHEIEVLNLDNDNNNDHTLLWDDMFVPFIKLKLLNLSKLRINYLPKNVFKGLKKIYEINLSYNELKHFDNSVFENLYTLYRLNLRGNPLQASYKPFISSSSVRELDLGYCSMIVLQNEFFHGVKKVTRLHLDGNHLQTIKEHVLPRGITHLNLASNRFVNVPISTITSLSQLRWINLGANPVNCTCSLLNLQDRLSGRGIIIDDDVRCAYPLELENISWSKINENELCNKETFRSRLNYRKPQSSKYIHSQKKGKFFENEKYSSLDSFQGDEPGKLESADYENYDDPKDIKNDDDFESEKNEENNKELTEKTEENVPGKATADDLINNNPATNDGVLLKTNDEKEPQGSSENENGTNVESITPKLENEVEIINNENTDDKKLAKQILSSPEGNEQQIGVNLTNSLHDTQNIGDKNETEEGTTQPSMTTDADLILTDIDISKKSNLDDLDENLKREDEIIPVVELSHSGHSEIDIADGDKNKNDSENNNSAGDENQDSGDHDRSIPHTGISDTNKQDDEVVNKSADIETPIIAKNESESFSENKNVLDDTIDNAKDHQNLNADSTTQIQKGKEYEENILDQSSNNLSNGKKENSGIGFDKGIDELHAVSTTLEAIVPDIGEGSGDDSIDPVVGNISVPVVDEDVTSETTVGSASETPVIVNPDITSVNIDNSNSEKSRKIVDKENDPYEAMGPYIVVVCIVVLIILLILISIYKVVRRKNKNNIKELPDLEASNGTELQDMKSLLPKTPVDDEKHNSKYPNEVSSPETVNLIKEDKNGDVHEPNGIHDLNQNDNKNDPVVKNGKAPEGSPPPIEITKAKLTVLLESIPRTPIFVQKRSATINNG